MLLASVTGAYGVAVSSGDLELIDRFYAALARRDGAAMAACYAPDATFSDPVFTDLSGREPGAMWQMLTERSDDLSVEVVEQAAAGGSGSATWVARYTFGQTGRPVVNRVRSTFRFAALVSATAAWAVVATTASAARSIARAAASACPGCPESGSCPSAAAAPARNSTPVPR